MEKNDDIKQLSTSKKQLKTDNMEDNRKHGATSIAYKKQPETLNQHLWETTGDMEQNNPRILIMTATGPQQLWETIGDRGQQLRKTTRVMD